MNGLSRDQSERRALRPVPSVAAGARSPSIPRRSSLVAYLEEVVQPALFEKLDAAFPEFGWRRTTAGWIATNRAFTKARFGVRPDRVICHRPFGFLIHGGEAHTWCAYVHGATPPKGRAFQYAIAALATRAGVPLPDDLAPPRRRDARPEILERLLRAAHRRLAEGGDSHAQKARAVLEGRGLSKDTWGELELGLTPSIEIDTEVAQPELHALGLTHAHWANRIVGPWRDVRGNLAAIFGRRLEAPGPKYLCSRGPRPPLFGLPLPDPSPAIVLVEGLFDVLALRAAGVRNVVAAAGTSVSPDAWTLLEGLGCRDLTLWLDTDVPGEAALLQAIQGSARALQDGPQLFVIHPEDARRAIRSRKRKKVDPNAVLLAAGRRGVLELLAKRWPARIYAALHGAEDDVDQALLGSLGAPDWDLKSVLKKIPDLSKDAREIALGAREADTLLQACLESGRALRRAGVPAAHVAAELARRLAQLAAEAGP